MFVIFKVTWVNKMYYSEGHKSCKWWRYLLSFLIDTSTVNAHILEKEALNHSSRSQMYFRLELAKMLIGDFSSHSLSVSDGRKRDGHWLKTVTKGRCRRCLKQKVVKFCRLACTSCDKRICLECFSNHTDRSGVMARSLKSLQCKSFAR